MPVTIYEIAWHGMACVMHGFGGCYTVIDIHTH